MEHDVHAVRRELLAILLERARIALEVLAAGELQPIDEDRRHHHRRVLVRDADQTQMTVVDVAHGRHARNPRLAVEPAAQLCYCFYDFHLCRQV